jgi:hypothetical protein
MKQLQIILSIVLSFPLFSTAHAGTCTTSQRADLATAGYKKAEIEKMCSDISSSTTSNLKQQQAELPKNSVFSVGQMVCEEISGEHKRVIGSAMGKNVYSRPEQRMYKISGYIENSNGNKIKIRIGGIQMFDSSRNLLENVDRVDGEIVYQNAAIIWDEAANWGSCDNTERSSSSLTSHTQQAEASNGIYVSQGGLTWVLMPMAFSKNWADANAFCTGTTINGQTGWRLPTQVELSALNTAYPYNSSVLHDYQGWPLIDVWSSTPGGSGSHYSAKLQNGTVYQEYDAIPNGVTCVRSNSSLTSHTQQTEGPKGNYVSQGGLTWMPTTFKKEWEGANAYCTNTAINGQTGWRLPTKDELSALYASGAMKGQGWVLNEVWSSEPSAPNVYGHNVVHLDRGGDSGFGGRSYVTCVR